MDGWVLCSEDLPVIEKGRQNMSVDVLARQGNGNEQVAYCDTRDGKWYRMSGAEISDVIAWQSLTEKEKSRPAVGAAKTA